MFTVTKCRVVAVVVLALMSVPLAGSASVGAAARPVDAGELLADLNAASDGSVATVLLQCKHFVPEVIEVQSGEEIYFLWDDPCQDIGHTVTASGTTFDPDEDLQKPEPTNSDVGKCFNSGVEPIGHLFGPDFPDYHLTLVYQGVVYRDLDETQQWTETPPYVLPFEPSPACLFDASYRIPDDPTNTAAYEAVVPYFCSRHGAAEGAVGFGDMRGAIVVEM